MELPPLQNHFQHDRFPPFHSPRPRELLPSMMAESPPGRSTTLPPIHRPRPRKSSLTKASVSQNARKPKHERTKSKEQARRMSIDGRKAFSAEPTNSLSISGSRWEDLIEAATSANEADSDRDLTPVCSLLLLWGFLHDLLISGRYLHRRNLSNVHRFLHFPPPSTISTPTKPHLCNMR